jgi:hypothetical protein
MTEASEEKSDYEHSDADPRLIAALALGGAVFLALTPLGLKGLYPLASHEPARLIAYPPAPRLQIDPRRDLDALRALETSRLSSYGWVNRADGIVHIPIDRAMQLTAQRGLPGWQRP